MTNFADQAGRGITSAQGRYKLSYEESVSDSFAKYPYAWKLEYLAEYPTYTDGAKSGLKLEAFCELWMHDAGYIFEEWVDECRAEGFIESAPVTFHRELIPA